MDCEKDKSLKQQAARHSLTAFTLYEAARDLRRVAAGLDLIGKDRDARNLRRMAKNIKAQLSRIMAK